MCLVTVIALYILVLGLLTRVWSMGKELLGRLKKLINEAARHLEKSYEKRTTLLLLLWKLAKQPASKTFRQKALPATQREERLGEGIGS